MNCSRSSGVSGISVTFAIATSYNPYTISPAKADIPISPIGEIPFFRTLLEPKYRVPRTIVIITAVVSTDNAPELPTMC
jgi:amino acid transporter